MTVNKRNKWVASAGATLLAISLVAGMGVDLPTANADNRAALRRDNSSNRRCEWDPVNHWVQELAPVTWASSWEELQKQLGDLDPNLVESATNPEEDLHD